MTRRPLTIGAFRRWLENASPCLRLRTRHNKMCPIARYLGNSRGNINVRVTASEIGSNGRTVRPPAWAAYFIRAFDKTEALYASPAHALKVLLESGYRKG